MKDIRDTIFRDILDTRFTAELRCEEDGVLAGCAAARQEATSIGVELVLRKEDGADLRCGNVIGTVTATPKAIAIAEERIIGSLAKFSGVASASRRAVELAGERMRVVSGSWKKMPPALKDGIREATAVGGVSFRISRTPMIYLDKNYIRMLGGIPATLRTVRDSSSTKVIQIRGEDLSVEEETRQALAGGAGILMVDTGRREDFARCQETVCAQGARERVEIAFAGGVKLEEIPAFDAMGVDILCIGRPIVDAPLLDMKLDVVAREEAARKWA